MICLPDKVNGISEATMALSELASLFSHANITLSRRLQHQWDPWTPNFLLALINVLIISPRNSFCWSFSPAKRGFPGDLGWWCFNKMIPKNNTTKFSLWWHDIIAYILYILSIYLQKFSKCYVCECDSVDEKFQMFDISHVNWLNMIDGILIWQFH